jgi:hypothetical protein
VCSKVSRRCYPADVCEDALTAISGLSYPVFLRWLVTSTLGQAVELACSKQPLGTHSRLSIPAPPARGRRERRRPRAGARGEWVQGRTSSRHDGR